MYWVSAFSLAALLAFNTPSTAAALTPEKATELLAKAWMVDNRCDVLDKQDRDDLTQFVARAEISVAEKVSVKAAQSAIAQGRDQGKALSCDETSADMVRDVLSAARSADGGTDGTAEEQSAKLTKPETLNPEPQQIAEPQPVEPIGTEPISDVADNLTPAEEAPVTKKIVPKPVREAKIELIQPRKATNKKPVREVARLSKISPKPIVKNKSGKVLKTAYASTAENYYKELRCRRMSTRAINAMYARVLREHQQAVSANGRNAVRSMLRAAESRAANSSC